MSERDVIIETQGGWGRITLNRPAALNALTHAMCCAIDDALAAWEDDNSVRAVMIEGAGERAFCAGGDIRALHDAVRRGQAGEAAAFFAREYRMNARIARFPKPYVALMDGITMGGGVGLSAHGAHRVVTERTMLAMPEVGIGLFPDVGGTFLLGRAPDNLGLHAALTAARMSGADAIALGLADHYVPADQINALTQNLLETGDAAGIDAVLREAAITAPASALASARDWIARCYAHETAEAICMALATDASPAARQAATTIRAQSPTSVKLTLRAVLEARVLGTLERCLNQEYRLAVRCVDSAEFHEGVRAAVIDKDRTPHWSPPTLEAVTDAAIDHYFAPLESGELGLTRGAVTH